MQGPRHKPMPENVTSMRENARLGMCGRENPLRSDKNVRNKPRLEIIYTLEVMLRPGWCKGGPLLSLRLRKAETRHR